MSRNLPSRFLKEIPDEVVEMKDNTAYAYSSGTSTASLGITQRAAPQKPATALSGMREKPQAAAIDYAVGDTVKHKVFGNGMILSMKPMANDVLVEVAFEKVGTKKIMANFARLTRQ